ncbi:MAG: O-methyltransferase [Candidatus Latescibacteria bacterium]|nr:O-methyltransferase [Candidatus Latescibacterota bacterium]
MSQASYPDLNTYRLSLFVQEDQVLKSVMPEAVALGLPPISVNPDAGQTLYLLARMIGARKILEFGALAGYSAIWLARALPREGRLISLEIDPKHARIARSNLARARLADRAEVRTGPALELMAEVSEEAPFDMIFIDADKESYPRYLDFAMDHVRLGGLIAADNADGHGHAHEVLEPGDGRRGIQTYNRRVASDRRLVSHILPIGGWLAVSVKVEE